ncbi:MAG TPA: magnesium chelatase subunit D family protein [Anaerolineae bacterium]
MARRAVFPFTAIVGQERMKRALILNAVSPQIGGVLIRGERGTAKSTAARALAALLPDIVVVADCRFGCDPDRPNEWCDDCRVRHAGGTLETLSRRTAFVDLPVSATEDRVVGTLDIEKAIQKGEKHFEPGVLASANRGLLYVDEVNLLDDHVVDLLLDSAAMGVNVVEREGISFSHPAKFILVGTMNPEEGDLRPQLLDRFAFCVQISGLTDPKERVQIMERRIAFEVDPNGFREEWAEQERYLSEQIARARDVVDHVRYTRRDLVSIAGLTGSLRVDGHRADLVILRGAQAHAAFQGREYITDQDIVLAAELALPHRIKGRPFQDTAITAQDLDERLQDVQSEMGTGEASEPLDSETESSTVKKKALDSEMSEGAEVRQMEAGPQTIPQTPQEGQWWEGGQKIQSRQEFTARRLDTQLDRLTRNQPGRRSQTRTERKRGRYIQARIPKRDKVSDLAFDATLRAAAPHQIHRDRSKLALALRKSDLREKVRVRRSANLILFVVDASWSMAVAERMEATKGAIMSLLTDAYQRRDRVGLIVFNKNEANLVLPPTNSVQLAKKALADIAVGGKTPLSAGLLMAYEVFRQEALVHPDVMPMMILLTDGAGNVSMSDLPPQEEGHRIAELIRETEVRSVVINMEHAAFDQGLARLLARKLDAPCHTLEDLRADTLYQTVLEELD